MKNNKKSPLNQFLTLGAIAVLSVFTWLNNESKEQGENNQVTRAQSSTTQNTPTNFQQSNSTNLPQHLGNYDTNMASDKYGQNIVSTDYYMLSLSWSPSFCASQREKNNGKIPQHLEFQCNQAAELGWVIHGLWPQSAKARSVYEQPRFCQGDLPALSEDLIKQYMPEAPGANLLQGQWEKHGACAFDTAEEYFAKQKALFKGLNLPGQKLSQKELFQWMKKFNPQLKNAYLKARSNELYICYDKQWNVMDCPR